MSSERLASFSPGQAAGLLGVSARRVRALLASGELAHVAIGARLVVLDGDVFADLEDDGRAALRRAWRDRRTIPVAEVAEGLGVSERSLVRQAKAGQFPLRQVRGRWVADRDRLVRWLLARRRPGRAEIGR